MSCSWAHSQETLGLAQRHSWGIAMPCCTDTQAGSGQACSGVLVQCSTGRHSWWVFSCQPSSGNSIKQPKNDELQQKLYAQQTARSGRTCVCWSLLHSQYSNRILCHHTLLQAGRAAVEGTASMGNFSLDATLITSQWLLSSKFKAVVKLSLQSHPQRLAINPEQEAWLGCWAGSEQVLLFCSPVKSAGTSKTSPESKIHLSVWFCSEIDGQSSLAALKGSCERNALDLCLVTQGKRQCESSAFLWRQQ